ASLGSLLVQKGEFAEAEPLLSKAIKLDEQNYPALSAMAELRLRTNAAEPVLRELLVTLTSLTAGKVNPPASAWASRAAIENRLGELRSAKASIARALAIEPSSISALAEAADIALRENDPSSAEEFTRRFAAAGGDADVVKIFRARALLLRDDVAGAEKILASVSPGNTDAANLLERIRASAAADPAELEKELEAKPNDPAVLGRLCTLYRRSDPPRALQYCQAAYNAEPGNSGHAVGFAAALVQAKNFAAAAELLKKLAAAEPENATIRANLATALFQLRRYQEAKPEFRWLIERQPELAAAYYFLGVSHDNLGEYLDAMANYQEFLRRAKIAEFKDEIDRINLRLPGLDRQIRSGKGKKTNEE
ncbi:MAG TPA: tetratricopeptide repeat protein, partial [Pyrinomonadaceae bacterium]|nr:tetratricopeptide repeat protein [Pyrinomonadaceae bacterium]